MSEHTNTKMSASASASAGDTVFDMSAFRDAVVQDPASGISRTLGENGHPELTVDGFVKKPGDMLVVLYYKLVRGFHHCEINTHIDRCIAEAKADRSIDMLEHVFVLMFQTRWTRGGKAEKLLSYQMFNVLMKFYPTIMVDLVELFPHYGYWKDLLLLLREMKKNPMHQVDYRPIKTKIYNMFADQLRIDHSTLTSTPEGKIPQIEGYCAKWAPSEGATDDKQLNAVSEICKVLYPELVGRDVLEGKDKSVISKNWRQAKMQYRHMITALRKSLDIPEVNMCAKHWEEIKIGRITSLCMNRRMNALLNELKTPPTPEQEETGNRHPDDPDRVALRKKLMKHIVEKGVSGKQLLPHELVENVLEKRLSSGTSALINAQWEKVVANCFEQIKARVSELQEQGKDINIDLTNMVCMSDVSGSMAGLPMYVSIALGILISQIAPEAFRDIVMTFSGSPKWHKFNPGMSFVQRVNSLSGADWGGNTNFEAAMNLIIDIIKRNGLSPQQVPNLLIVSDMQIDAARSDGWQGQDATPWATMYERIKGSFTAIGMPTPTIIFMNVRSGTVGFPTAADQEGTMLLSGWSPSVFKFLLSGEMEEDEEVVDELTGEVKTVKKKITGVETVHKILTDGGLDPVRAVLEKHRDILGKF